MTRLLGLGPLIVLLIALAHSAATAGEIHYSQFAPTVSRDEAAINDPDDPYGWSAGIGSGAPFEYPLGVRAPWWKHWFYANPLDLDRQTWWAGNDLSVEVAGASAMRDLIKVIVHGTSPEPISDRPVFPPVGLDSLAAEPQVVLQPPDRFLAVEPSRLIRMFDVNNEFGSKDIRPASFVRRRKMTPIPEEDAPRHCAPEVAALVFVVLGIAVLTPLRRRWMNR